MNAARKGNCSFAKTAYRISWIRRYWLHSVAWPTQS